MTLVEFLALLKADPGNPASPALLVAEGNLTTAQREAVIGSHARNPFAVVVSTSRAAPRTMHNGRAVLTGALDVHLHHPASAQRVTPNGDALARLQAAVLDARDNVTEARAGYPLIGRLALVSEVDPHPSSIAPNLDGLTAITRFTYRIWR